MNDVISLRSWGGTGNYSKSLTFGDSAHLISPSPSPSLSRPSTNRNQNPKTKPNQEPKAKDKKQPNKERKLRIQTTPQEENATIYINAERRKRYYIYKNTESKNSALNDSSPPPPPAPPQDRTRTPRRPWRTHRRAGPCYTAITR